MKNEPIYNLLNTINYPEDLRKLDVEQLPEVCSELRQDIIKELCCNPGHFAASLGTVELTVALHYVYNTPYDRIVWDVGHHGPRPPHPLERGGDQLPEILPLLGHLNAKKARSRETGNGLSICIKLCSGPPPGARRSTSPAAWAFRSCRWGCGARRQR